MGRGSDPRLIVFPLRNIRPDLPYELASAKGGALRTASGCCVFHRLLVPIFLSAFVPLLLGCGHHTAASMSNPGSQGSSGPPSGALASVLARIPNANVLVVSFDAMRADALGVYGHGDDISPNIDAFAAKSLVFDQAHTAAPVTPTSFSAAFSGELPVRVFRGWHFSAPQTLAGHFAKAGYKTAAFLDNVQLVAKRGFEAGFQTYEVDPKQGTTDKKNLEWSMAWLHEHRHQRFFLWVHFINPHSPYDWRKMAERFYDSRYRGPFEKTSGADFHPTDPKDIARLRSLYDGEVFFADSLFGKLIKQVEQMKLLGSTIVVLTADHGEEFGEHGAFQHKHLTEETVRIPLIIHEPGMSAGRRTSVLESNLDLFPTLAGMTGHPLRGRSDGEDIRRVHLAQKRDLVSIAMTDRHYRAVSVRRGPYKLIVECKPAPGMLLFDLASDPGELSNLAATRPKLVARMSRAMRSAIGAPPCPAVKHAAAGKRPDRGLLRGTVHALKSLGYL